MTASNDVNGDGETADKPEVPWGPEQFEDAENPVPASSPNYKTDDQIMQEKEQRQKAEIYRGTRTKFSPAVQKWRQRQR